ncbi:MAG TPA: hypothetical protein VK901_20230 [Nitrospiraceae bacterium]|nr:hypothetical protein [Nitrospiraceae bacterium]
MAYYENTGGYELAIGQLILKFKRLANKGMGKLLRLSTARKLDEISEIVNRWRQRLWHQRLGLSI